MSKRDGDAVASCSKQHDMHHSTMSCCRLSQLHLLCHDNGDNVPVCLL